MVDQGSDVRVLFLPGGFACSPQNNPYPIQQLFLLVSLVVLSNEFVEFLDYLVEDVFGDNFGEFVVLGE